VKWKLAVVAALAAVTAVCVAGVAGAAKQAPGAITFHLIEKDGGGNFVDNKPYAKGQRGPASLGDMFVFNATLLTPAKKPAGSLDATCTVTRAGKSPSFVCTGTFTLARGQLELQTVMQEGTRTTHIAVIGGTGAYEGARGSITAVSRGENSPYTDDTVHLLPKAA
jgi:hypothetical protein